jgi:hypothetical protein
VIECVPTDNVDVGKVAVAVAPDPLNVPEPMTVPPSSKFTVPVGVIEPSVAVIVAVNVTDVPDVDGLRLETSPFDVVWSTDCETVFDRLEALFASPP